MDKQNSEWMPCDPWYNTSICEKLLGKLFEGFIRNTITEIYIIICSIDAHEKDHQSSSDDGSSGGNFPLPTKFNNRSIRFTQCNNIFYPFLAKSLKT